MKSTKTLDLLTRPTRFELVTLGLEMRGIGYTNDLVLHRFVILQRVYENGLKTHLSKLRNRVNDRTMGRINFFLPETRIEIVFS